LNLFINFKISTLQYPNEWMVVCQVCDETFHAQCHSPALVRKPVGKWICYRCTVDKALAIGCNTIVYPDAPPLIIELPKGLQKSIFLDCDILQFEICN
jgi:PHD-finger